MRPPASRAPSRFTRAPASPAGIIGHAAGDEARLCVDASRLAPGQQFVVILGHLISYEHMGVALVGCADECACARAEVDAHVPGGQFSVFKAKTFKAWKTNGAARPSADATAGTNVSSYAPALGREARSKLVKVGGRPAKCGCKVELSIQSRSGSGEHKFKVLSLMTAAREGSLRYGHQAGFNNRPTEARFH